MACDYQFNHEKLLSKDWTYLKACVLNIYDNAFARSINFIRVISELGTHFRNLAAGLRHKPLRANNCQCQRSGWVPRPSIEINRLVESREKTGKARHRRLWVPGPPSFALLASREWSGVAWRLVTSQPVANHCPLCSAPLSLSLPPPSLSQHACARTDVAFFESRKMSFVWKWKKKRLRNKDFDKFVI